MSVQVAGQQGAVGEGVGGAVGEGEGAGVGDTVGEGVGAGVGGVGAGVRWESHVQHGRQSSSSIRQVRCVSGTWWQAYAAVES